jgi:hypothetical protein
MSTDRHQPLDADERELARVLRALPAGEPPSSLDAKILAMARDAVVTTPSVGDEARPRRTPRFAWGLGAAASCVLAAGLVWRMGGFGGESLDAVGSAAPEAAADVAAAAAQPQPAPPMPEAESASIAVEIGGPRAAPRTTIVPPPPPPAETPTRQRAAAASAENLAAERREALPDARASDSAFAPEPPVADAALAMPAPVAAPAAPAPAAAMAEQAELQRVVVTGSRIDADLARPVAEDGNAGAQAWIQRIRARIARGDEDGARESLEAFIAQHAGKPLPQDLIDFRARASEP